MRLRRTGGSKGQISGAATWVRSLFDRIDAKDTEGWLEHLSNDARFCFGNAPELVGKGAIRDGVNAFFSTLSAIKHDIIETWSSTDTIICHGQVSYARLDGSTLSVPFAVVFKLEGEGLVREYLIFADISKL